MKLRKNLWWAIAVAMLGSATIVPATTLKVDGPGDGDGDSIDDFDTITAALIALGPLGTDGQPDVINIVVDKLDNHPGILINGGPTPAPGGTPPNVFPSLTDSITINGDADGNGSPCVVVLADGTKGTTVPGGYSFNTARFAIEVANNQRVTLRDLTLIPKYFASAIDTRTDGVGAPNCLYIDEAGTPANMANVFTLLERVTVTGADQFDNPVDPFNPPIANATYWGSDTAFVAQIVYASNNNGANFFRHVLQDVVSAHGGSASGTAGVHGLGIYCDGNQTNPFAISQAQVLIDGGFFSRNGNQKGTFPGLVAQGIQVSGANGTEVILNNVTSTRNGKDSAPVSTTGNGLSVTASPVGTDQRIVVNGGTYNNNYGGGIFLNTNENAVGLPSLVVELNGTYTNPIFMQDNVNQGLRLGNTTNADIRIDRAERMIITGNGSHGIEFFEIAEANYDPPGPDANITFRDSIFANNRTNFRNGDTNSTPATLRFVDCTFHNPGNLTPPPGTFADAHIVLNFGGCDFFTHLFEDCIFSGGDPTDRLICVGNQDTDYTNDGDDNSFIFVGCSIVQAGPFTNETNINQLILNATDPLTGNNNTVNGISIATIGALPPGTLTVNPNYASTVPGGFASPFLDVQNAFPNPFGYAEMPFANHNLAGGADFLYVLPDATVTPTAPLPWPVTFFDNNTDDPLYTPNGNARVNVTNFTGTLPLVWTPTNPLGDPSFGVAPIFTTHLQTEWWTIDHNQGAFDVTADVTLRYNPFDPNPVNTFGVTNIHRYDGAFWVAQNPPNSIGISPVPGLIEITAVGVPQFSPFAVIDNATLAVDLVSFTAAQTGSTVTVSWTTAAELDNAGFVVYRANANGSRGEKLSGLIPAEGSASAGANYSFVDNAPIAAGETSRSYLLVDIDLSGAETVHGPATATITSGPLSNVGSWMLY